MNVAAERLLVSENERDGLEKLSERSLILKCRAAVDWLAGVESLSSLQASTVCVIFLLNEQCFFLNLKLNKLIETLFWFIQKLL